MLVLHLTFDQEVP